jgi:uncharacterized protein (DUF1800 family)
MKDPLREKRLIDRASFGARRGDREAIHSIGAEAWVHGQLAERQPQDPRLDERLEKIQGSGAESMAEGMKLVSATRDSGDADRRRELKRRARETALTVASGRLVRAVHGNAPLRDVMLDFWSNHFSVFGRKRMVGLLLPQYERETLLPHVFGRFEDLLIAVAQSPAMLVYLDNWRSTRADLPRALRRRLRGAGGINENYARELLELHTLGVNGGYDQGDVVAVAKILTGWTLASRSEPVFRFREALHDAGSRRVLGQRFAGGGLAQGKALLRMLARHPSTAKHVSRKLCVRFVGDAPPPALVDRVARRFLESEGDLRVVTAEVLLARELTDPAHRKLKTPLRFFAGALRATNGATDGGRHAIAALARLGEVPFGWRTPDGFPEQASYWIDPGAMLERMSIAFQLAQGRVQGTSLGSGIPDSLPKAESGKSFSFVDAQALALASPEFQWA